MRSLVLVFLAAFLSMALSHPFSVHDMIELDRVGTPVVNPSGTRAVFTRWTYDFATHTSAQSLWLTDLVSGNGTTQVTTSPFGSSDFNPDWLDDSTIVFLSASRSSTGSPQIFSVRSTGGAVTQLASYPVGIDTFRVFSSSGTKKIGFTARVYDDATLQQTSEIDAQKAKEPSSALAYDHLFFRHWDTFSDHKNSHIFVTSLTEDAQGNYALEAADPVDLMFNQDLESPILPFGGTTDYAFSADGTLCAFAARKPGLDQAWSTDTNIYLVNVTGATPAWAFTAHNPGYDTFPVFSPSGVYVAYLSMFVPKYEADRRRVVLFNIATGVHTILTDLWDRSPESIVWSADSSQIFVTVADDARENVYVINVGSKQVSFLIRGGYISGLSLTPRGLAFALNNQLAPNEIYTFEGSTLSQKTFINQAKLAVSSLFS